LLTPALIAGLQVRKQGGLHNWASVRRLLQFSKITLHEADIRPQEGTIKSRVGWFSIVAMWVTLASIRLTNFLVNCRVLFSVR